MKVVGIVAEYNPFHNGHTYHLNMAKQLTGADYAVVVMSPDFVQRGEPAIVNKYVRTRMALRSGADLVLELPAFFACSSAEYFASGAVGILDSLGLVDTLVFGSEFAQMNLFEDLADFFLSEPEEYRRELNICLKKGMTFPEARSHACITYLENNGYLNNLGKSAADQNKNANRIVSSEWSLTAIAIISLLSSPNNILGLEYIKALKKRGSRIQPFTIKRIGRKYHDTTLDGIFCSASAIRAKLLSDHALRPELLSDSEKFQPEASLSTFLPEESWALLNKEIYAGRILSMEDFSPILRYKLLSISSFGNSFAKYLDVSEDLSDRIIKMLPFYENAAQFTTLLKTKQLTEARIRRALLHILLEIKKTAPGNGAQPRQDMSFTDSGKANACSNVNYARILGFRKDAAPLLHEIKKQASIPVITKPAHAKKLLKPAAYEMFSQDIFASHVYQSVLSTKTGEPAKNEFRRSPVLL